MPVFRRFKYILPIIRQRYTAKTALKWWGSKKWSFAEQTNVDRQFENPWLKTKGENKGMFKCQAQQANPEKVLDKISHMGFPFFIHS